MRARPLRERLSKETLEKLYWNDGLTTVQIAERFGSFASNVLVLMEKYGIPRRSKGAGKPQSVQRMRRSPIQRGGLK